MLMLANMVYIYIVFISHYDTVIDLFIYLQSMKKMNILRMYVIDIKNYSCV